MGLRTQLLSLTVRSEGRRGAHSRVTHSPREARLQLVNAVRKPHAFLQSLLRFQSIQQAVRAMLEVVACRLKKGRR